MVERLAVDGDVLRGKSGPYGDAFREELGLSDRFSVEKTNPCCESGVSGYHTGGWDQGDGVCKR